MTNVCLHYRGVTFNKEHPSFLKSIRSDDVPRPQATPRFYLAGCEIKSGSGLGTRLAMMDMAAISWKLSDFLTSHIWSSPAYQ